MKAFMIENHSESLNPVSKIDYFVALVHMPTTSSSIANKYMIPKFDQCILIRTSVVPLYYDMLGKP